MEKPTQKNNIYLQLSSGYEYLLKFVFHKKKEECSIYKYMCAKTGQPPDCISLIAGDIVNEGCARSHPPKDHFEFRERPAVRRETDEGSLDHKALENSLLDPLTRSSGILFCFVLFVCCLLFQLHDCPRIFSFHIALSRSFTVNSINN